MHALEHVVLDVKILEADGRGKYRRKVGQNAGGHVLPQLLKHQVMSRFVDDHKQRVREKRPHQVRHRNGPVPGLVAQQVGQRHLGSHTARPDEESGGVARHQLLHLGVRLDDLAGAHAVRLGGRGNGESGRSWGQCED